MGCICLKAVDCTSVMHTMSELEKCECGTFCGTYTVMSQANFQFDNTCERAFQRYLAAVAMPKNGDCKGLPRPTPLTTLSAADNAAPSSADWTARPRGPQVRGDGRPQRWRAEDKHTEQSNAPKPTTQPRLPRRKPARARTHARTLPAPRSLRLYCACLGEGAAIDREAQAGAEQRGSSRPGR